MTTIVFRDGVMAADTRGYAGNKLPIGTKSKIFELGDGAPEGMRGCFLGISSIIVGCGQQIFDWINAGMPRDQLPVMERPDFQAVLARPDGKWLFWSGSFYPTGPLTGEFIAIGSGEEYALGALEMGASALEAVKIAAKLDPWSAPPFETLDFRARGRWSLMAS